MVIRPLKPGRAHVQARTGPHQRACASARETERMGLRARVYVRGCTRTGVRTSVRARACAHGRARGESTSKWRGRPRSSAIHLDQRHREDLCDNCRSLCLGLALGEAVGEGVREEPVTACAQLRRDFGRRPAPLQHATAAKPTKRRKAKADHAWIAAPGLASTRVELRRACLETPTTQTRSKRGTKNRWRVR